MKKTNIENLEKRGQLLNRIKTVRLDDMEFWDELRSVTTAEDFAQIRQTFREWKKIDKNSSIPSDFNRFKGNFERDAEMFSRRMLINAGDIQEKDRAMLDFLLNKHEEGLIGWTGENEVDWENYIYFNSLSGGYDDNAISDKELSKIVEERNFKPISLFEEPDDEDNYSGFNQID